MREERWMSFEEFKQVNIPTHTQRNKLIEQLERYNVTINRPEETLLTQDIDRLNGIDD